MHQNEELNRIKARIKALASKTVDAGCSEAEALSAALKVGELLQQYNLSMEEIDIREAKCVTIRIDSGGKSRGGMDTIAVAIGEYADCKVWFSRGGWQRDESGGYIKDAKGRYVRANSEYAFFGQESDTEAVRYLYEVIRAALTTETESFKKTEQYLKASNKKGAYVSFQVGFASRVGDRLRKIKRENDEALRRAHEERMRAHADVAEARVAEAEVYTERERRAAAVTGTALIVLKKQLVEQEFKARGPKLGRHYYSRTVRYSDSYYAGREAGGRVNLNRPVGGGKVGGYLK